MPEQKKTVSQDEVRHLAKLCKLTLTTEEEQLFTRQMGEILAHIDTLSQIETSDVEPLYNPLDEVARLREDQTENLRSRSEILANAPKSDGKYFIVPRIV